MATRGDLVLLGSDARVRINNQIFPVTGGEIRIVAQQHDVTDTEADADALGTYEDFKGGLNHLEIDLEFQHSLNANIYQPPFNLRPNSVVSVYVYADTLAAAAPYFIPNALVLPGSRGLGLRGPQTGRLRVQSKGKYYLPGDT